MIKFVMCLTRHPRMTREEVRDYWENKHGPFFMKNADTMGAKRYGAISHPEHTAE